LSESAESTSLLKNLMSNSIAFLPYPMFCTCGLVAILTIRIPSRDANDSSWNCSDMHHEIKSPEGFISLLLKLLETNFLSNSPSIAN